jgi:hypothetical protein
VSDGVGTLIARATAYLLRWPEPTDSALVANLRDALVASVAAEARVKELEGELENACAAGATFEARVEELTEALEEIVSLVDTKAREMPHARRIARAALAAGKEQGGGDQR